MESDYLFIRQYNGAEKRQERRLAIAQQVDLSLDGWLVSVKVELNDDRWLFEATVLEIGTGQIALGLGRTVQNAGQSHLAVPAAVYDGNRFRALPLEYPCILREEADLRPDLPTTISWVPRLPNLQLLAGDAALPAIGVIDTSKGGFWWFTGQRTVWGETGIEALETEGSLEVSFLFPGVREHAVYNGSPNWRPSPDRGAEPSCGSKMHFEVFQRKFHGATPRDLYRCLFENRKVFYSTKPRHGLPFSEAGRLIEAKHNDRYWNEKDGYYMLSDGTWEYGQWQAGWVGGGIQMFALSTSEDDTTRSRVRRMLDFVAGPAQAESGLYWSLYTNDGPCTDMVGMEWGHDWHLVRRSGDVLYFLLKTLEVLERRGEALEPLWIESCRRAADALQAIWQRFGRFGMFVSQQTLEIRSGDTASGAIVPAALTLAAKRLQNGSYLDTALDAATYYVQNYLENGYTNGGPGEAAQCPDSESAFALLESTVELFEATKESKWLDHAEAAARLAASWVMPYDFEFPEGSTFQKLEMQTTGSVWANIQNKHSAPGICTLSGVSLLKLYRWTKNPAYLELLKDIAHGVTQYLSREDRVVFDLPPGASCERVNTSDWEAPERGPGEGFSIDCWSSISAQLTWAEVPGVYANPETGSVVVLDHVDLVETRRECGGLRLLLSNPTRFEAQVRILAESEGQALMDLGNAFAHDLPTVTVPAGGVETILVPIA